MVAAVRPYGDDDNSFLSAGGFEGLQLLSASFYGHMDRLPEARVIREMHPQDQVESVDKLARFLCGWLGGLHLESQPRARTHLAAVRAPGRRWKNCWSSGDFE